MTTNRLVGSTAARVAAVVLAVATLGVAATITTAPPSRFYFALALGVLTWVSLVHTSHRLFQMWMRFAEALHSVVVTSIFGLCYLLVVPVFRAVLWFRDPLQLRRAARETSWVRRPADVNVDSLERMG